MPKPLVSCIVPAYNAEKLIAESLQTIFDQTYRPIEVIVIDDGSTDRTAAVVKSFGDAIRYMRQDNAGPAHARNLGLSLAQGEYITFLDADDLWIATKTAWQVEELKSNPALDYCVGQMENFWDPSVPIEERMEDSGARVRGVIDGFSPITLMARRTVFERIGGYEPSFHMAEDWDWFVRAHDYQLSYHVIPRVVARRRLHVGNRTSGLALTARMELLPVLRASLLRRRAVDRTEKAGENQ